jgi:hypothetical protein
METALHGNDRHSAKPTAKQPAAVPNSRRAQEMWHFAVIDLGIAFDRITHGAQTGTQDDSYARTDVPRSVDSFDRIVDLIDKMSHWEGVLEQHNRAEETVVATIRLGKFC